MTFDSYASGGKKLSLLITTILLTTGTTSWAKNNDEHVTSCPPDLSPEEFLECLCEEEGGIYWETDTEYGCWQLEPGEFDYICLRGQPLSSCIVTLPAVDPPDENPENGPITGAVSGGPGGGNAVSVDPTNPGPPAPDFEVLEQNDSPSFFAGQGTASSINKADQFRSLSDSADGDNEAAGEKEIDSKDDKPNVDATDDPAVDESVDSIEESQATEDTDVADERNALSAQASGPCGAGAMAAVAMTIAGLSLIGGCRRRH